MRVLLTGATGFVGIPLVHHLINNDFNVVAAVRKQSDSLPSKIRQIRIGDLLPETNWSDTLLNVDVVIHLAARVHIMSDTSTNPLEDFRKTNTISTLNLAHQAASNGVRRFIYLSSIKVNGESTEIGSPFREDDSNIPIDPYGLSKYEAEQGLKKIALKTGMEVVIIRPPLVYGPNVKANFYTMMNWLNKGIPLPLGAIHNRRSLVALENILDLITLCIDHPSAGNQTFLVSDDEDLSTTELLQRLSNAIGKPSRLIPVPSSILSFFAVLLGKEDMANRLCGSLQVDISHTKNILGWIPPVSIEESLKGTANAYLEHVNKNNRH